ncbi:MAG: phosphatase PAP2 family protein, partial [Actinomycetota bacterium]
PRRLPPHRSPGHRPPLHRSPRQAPPLPPRASRIARQLPSEPRSDAVARVPGAPPWWLVVLAAAVFVAVTVDVIHGGLLSQLDAAVSRRMRALDLVHRPVKPVIYPLTLFGQRGTVLGVTVPIACWLSWRSRSVEPLLRYAVALLCLLAVVTAAKSSVTRPPPSAVPGVPSPHDSYPSGHIANAVAIWGVIAACAARTGLRGVAMGCLNVVRVAGPLAVFAGMTLLNYHWLSDFVGGACIGVVLLTVALAPCWRRAAATVDRRLRGRQAASS